MKWRPNKPNADRPLENAKPSAPAPAAKKRTKPGVEGQKTTSKGRKSFILLVGDEGAILVFMQGPTLVRRLFAASPQSDHTAPLAELLKANPRVPVFLLADVLDQQYVRHTFPPVSSMSIAGLVKRRIERDFNPEDMKSALPLGRETVGRKEWQFLIISLANTPLMQQWVEFLVELPNKMLGVYLLPVEMQQLLPVLSKALGETRDLPWKLLVTHNKVSGFRLAVLLDGKLVFTRVSQSVEELIPAVIAGNIEQEIISTVEYIRRLGFKENDTLEMMVIAAQEVTDVLDLKRFNAGASYAVTPYDVAEALQLKQAALSADRFGDVVVAAAIANQRKRVLRFSNRYIDKLAQLYLAHTVMYAASVLILLALLGLTGATALAMFNAKRALAESAAKKQAVLSEISDLQHAIDGQDKNVAYKSVVTAAYDAFSKNKPTPNAFAAELGPLLGDTMRVTHWEWNTKLAAPAGGAATAATNAAKPITVDFMMKTSSGEPEALTKAADKFLALLKEKMKDYDITAAPYAWINQKPDNQEISLDAALPTTQTTKQSSAENKVTVTFTGPHPPAAGNAATPAGAGR